MAKFIKQTSDVALALDRLQNFAENLISYETQRRTQLGREKETRMIDAYKYMLGNEEEQIVELETALVAIEDNLEARGLEQLKLADEQRTVNFNAILSAANEGAAEMVQVRLADSQDYKARLEAKRREASGVLRAINIYDDAMTIVDPAATGEKNIVEASDVAAATDIFKTEYKKVYDEYGDEIEQRRAQLETAPELDRLQTAYYAGKAEEIKQKEIAALAEQTDALLAVKSSEPEIKETQEAFTALLNQNDTMFKLSSELGAIKMNMIDLQSEEDLSTADIAKKEEEIAAENTRLGSYLFPWVGPDTSKDVKEFFTAWITAQEKGNYYSLVGYFKQFNAQYNKGKREGATWVDRFQQDMLSMFGVDVSDDEWIATLDFFHKRAGEIHIKQGKAFVQAKMDLVPDDPEYGDDKDPLRVKYGLE
jgi:hypothetical protein